MSFRQFDLIDPANYRSRLPVAFDNSMDLYEQMTAVIEYFNVVIANSNEVTADIILMRKQFVAFKLLIETELLPDNLNILLTSWLKSGKLNDIINGALSEVTAQMRKDIELLDNKKADISYVNDLIANFSSTLVDSVGTLLELNEKYPNGRAGTVLVKSTDHAFIYVDGEWKDFGVWNNASLKDFSVTVNKTNFVSTGKNKFNIDTLGSGYYGTDGILYPNDEYGYSDYIVVKGGEEYIFSRTVAENTHVRERIGISFISAYSDIGILPEAGGRTVSSYIVPEGVTRIRLSSGLAIMNRKLQMELGTTFTAYEKYKRTIRYLKTTVENDDIVTRTIDQDKLRLPPDMVPKMFYFSNGTLNSGKFNSVSSTRVATIDRFFAKKGSIVNVVGATDVEFTVHILTEDDEYVKNSNWSSTQYVFDSDCYFRISAKYMTDVATPESKLPYFNNSFFLSSNNPYSVVLKSEQSAGGSESDGKGRALILPPHYPVVIDKQMNVSLDNVLQYGNYYTSENYKVRGKGNIIEGMYQLEGSTNQTLILDYYEGNQLTLTNSLPIKAIAKSSGGSTTKKVLLIGESTTDSLLFVNALLANFTSDTMKLSLLGGRGTSPANHEGRSGWGSQNFVNNQTYKSLENAFYNPATSTFSFAYYMAQMGYTSVDYVCINLGINDVADGYNTTQILANYKKMIDSIRSYNSTIKIVIGLTNLPSKHTNQNGFDLKTKLLSLINELITVYGNRESENFFLTPIYLNIDPFWDMRYKTVPLSNVNSKTVLVGDDQVHPSEIGYKKSADVHYCVFKYIASLG